MASKFQVDVVATPHLDLCSAAAKDLNAREANGGKYPIPSRSQMAREQEKLNKFLQYVNESFIIKGFSKSASAADSSGFRGYSTVFTSEELWIEGEEANIGNLQISHGDGAQILLLMTLTGDGASRTATPALLTVHIYENDSEIAAFQRYCDGYFTMSLPFLLANRTAGLTEVSLRGTVTGGEVYVGSNGAFAQALVLE